MQSAVWERLFRGIPQHHQNHLSLTTQAGVEIAVQSLLRIEAECVVVRGRLSGSQDAGRVFFIPYQQIDHLGFMREMKESEFNEDFSGMDLSSQPPVEATVTTEASPVSSALPSLQTTSGGGDELVLAASTEETGAPPPARRDTPIKSEVLERFRNRTGSGASGIIKPSGS